MENLRQGRRPAAVELTGGAEEDVSAGAQRGFGIVHPRIEFAEMLEGSADGKSAWRGR